MKNDKILSYMSIITCLSHAWHVAVQFVLVCKIWIVVLYKGLNYVGPSTVTKAFNYVAYKPNLWFYWHVIWQRLALTWPSGGLLWGGCGRCSSWVAPRLSLALDDQVHCQTVLHLVSAQRLRVLHDLPRKDKTELLRLSIELLRHHFFELLHIDCIKLMFNNNNIHSVF